MTINDPAGERQRRTISRLLGSLFAGLIGMAAYGNAASFDDLADLNLEDLMQIEITSVSKSPQALSDTTAAVHVISRDDIRRSGLTSIPELLRQVPGLEVARINGNQWAVTSRGFNGTFSNKLLVLVDGRSVYTSIFSGVYWDAQDTLLEDVDRIEVIRGPGGSVWGANAVNGVINIVTRSSRDTHGGFLLGTAGDRGSRVAAMRYGAPLGDNGHFRVFAKGMQQDDFDALGGGKAHDRLRGVRGGGRADWGKTGDVVTVLGDVYASRADVTTPSVSLVPPGGSVIDDTVELSGASLLAQWNRKLSDGATLSFQAYVDRAEREATFSKEHVDTLDLEVRHRFALTGHQLLSWGMNYRGIHDRIENMTSATFTPSERSTSLYSAFLRDEVTLNDDWMLNLGAKIEHNDYTGVEFMPSAQLLWRLGPRQRLWGSIARAVRTPSRANSDIRIDLAAFPGSPLPTLISIVGNSDFKSEELLAYEIGYRSVIAEGLTLDAAAFYNDYDNLLTTESLMPVVESDPQPPHLLLARRFENRLSGGMYGVDLSAGWQINSRWRVNLAYSWLAADLRVAPGSTDIGRPDAVAGVSPKQQFQLRSRYDFASNFELDMAWFWIDALPALNTDSVSRLDLRAAWHVSDSLELSVSGQNLIDGRHLEFRTFDATPSYVPRSIALTARVSF